LFVGRQKVCKIGFLQRKALPTAPRGVGTKQGRDISFSKRDTPPFDPPRENSIGSLQLEGVRRLGNDSALRGGIASLAAIVVARRFDFLLLPAAALESERECGVITFYR
jgi:hypothetical protein